jgi:hypothetical protein
VLGYKGIEFTLQVAELLPVATGSTSLSPFEIQALRHSNEAAM